MEFLSERNEGNAVFIGSMKDTRCQPLGEKAFRQNSDLDVVTVESADYIKCQILNPWNTPLVDNIEHQKVRHEGHMDNDYAYS